MGLISGALSGLGEGMMIAGSKYGDYLSRSELQKEAAEITAQRDKTLQAFQHGERVEGQTFTAGENTLNRQQQTDLETTRQGGENARLRETLGQRERENQNQTGLRQMELEVQGGKLAEERRSNIARERILSASTGAQVTGANLDADIKRIQLDNARRVKTLQEEFRAAPPERRASITEEVQLLTGKDNDNYVPVPMKDETGAITGYQVFDKKRGTMVDARPKGPASAGGRPPLNSFAR